MPHIGRINVTPLKGTALDHPGEVRLTPLGIPGNRRFHLVDAHGRLFTAADHGPLMRVRLEVSGTADRLRLELPGEDPLEAPLDASGEAVVTDFYGRPVPGRVIAGPVADALGGYVGRSVRLVRTDVEGDGSDEHHLSLLSWASVADLGARDGRPDLDPRRFRMDLELDGCRPYEEDGWAGRQVRIGSAVIRVLGPIPRCVVTTRDPSTGLKDFDTLKRIAAYRPLMTEPRGVPFGMYAEVAVPGRVAVGDAVELLPG